MCRFSAVREFKREADNCSRNIVAKLHSGCSFIRLFIKRQERHNPSYMARVLKVRRYRLRLEQFQC
ncbi:hypothetical protein MnTg02_01035 [bacterium MnTg02]|nr:hypothetical protein MnTg02_01035 [bacterium MnTg02]